MDFIIPYHEIYYISSSEIIAIHMAIMRRYGRSKIYVTKKRIEEIVDHYRNAEGDIFQKAAILLVDLIREKPRPFEDGHKRTAWIAVVRFLQKNNYYFFDPVKLSDKQYLEKEIVEILVKIQQNRIKQIGSVRSWLQQQFSSLNSPGV